MSFTEKIRTKRVLIPAVAAVAVIGVGGITWAAVAGDDDDLSPAQRDDAGEAALAEVGGGRVLDVDVDDDTDEGGARVYEVEVVDADGREWDITLDEDFVVLVADPDDDDRSSNGSGDSSNEASNGSTEGAGNGGSNGEGNSGGNGSQGVDDDAPISAEERSQAEAAAVAAVEGSTAIDVDRSDDRGEAWEVEVVDADGVEWDVTLDADFAVISAVRD